MIVSVRSQQPIDPTSVFDRACSCIIITVVRIRQCSGADPEFGNGFITGYGEENGSPHWGPGAKPRQEIWKTLSHKLMISVNYTTVIYM